MPAQLQQPLRSFGILTGGGDVPGLNAAIKTLVARAEAGGIRVTGLRGGWEGITLLDRAQGLAGTRFDPHDAATWESGSHQPLTTLNTRDIDRQGGTILQSTRTNPARVKVADLPAHLATYAIAQPTGATVDLTAEVLANMAFLELDGLVVIGGDDTLSYGATLAAQGVPVWGIAKTMDNDVPGTDYCIGFQTAISRAAELIGRIRSTAASHRETVLFRLFGRDAGFTALETAIVTGADRVLIPEMPADIDRLAAGIAADRRNPQRYSIVVLSEGANLGRAVPEEGPADAYGHRKKTNIAEFLAGELTARLPGVRFLPIDVTYVLRSGEPEVYDKQMAITYAHLVMNLLTAGTHGVMAAHRAGAFLYTDIPSKQYAARRVDPRAYDAEAYRPSFAYLGGPYAPQG